MSSIKLFRGEFGHISVLNVSSDLVTHAHAEAHIILWLRGAPGEMTVGEDLVSLGPDTATAVNSFEPHSHAMPGNGASGWFLVFYLDPDWVRLRLGLSATTPIFAGPRISIAAHLRSMAVSLLDLLAECDGMDDMAGYELERLIDSLLDAAAPAEGQSQARHGRPAKDFRVRKAIELMRDNVAERICLDDVARSVGLSRPHFFALFKEQMKLTPNVYWNTLRMEEAVRQLQTSQQPLTSLACNLGFTTQGNFTRFFRDHAGVPPTLYREAAQAAA